MRVISEKKLREFWTRHPNAESSLRNWIKVVRVERWTGFADVRSTFGTVDRVGDRLIFNIGGNKYRLIAVPHYNRGKLFIRHVMTHAEYMRGAWKAE